MRNGCRKMFWSQNEFPSRLDDIQKRTGQGYFQIPRNQGNLSGGMVKLFNGVHCRPCHDTTVFREADQVIVSGQDAFFESAALAARRFDRAQEVFDRADKSRNPHH